MGRCSMRGFSMIELLVVLFIIALGSSLAVAWLGGTDTTSRLRGTAQQLAAEFQLAGEVATARQQVIGWQPLAEGYRFVAWQADGRWQPWGERSGLTPQPWPLPLRPERVPPLNDEGARQGAQPNSGQPWLVWWPDGEVFGGRLILHSEDARIALDVDALSVQLNVNGDQ
jgi:general secretion pathway protein H